MAQTIEILRKRWREVTVIIALWLYTFIGTELFRRNAPGILSALIALLVTVGLVFVSILWFGFLRTAYLTHSKRQTLWTLLKEGKRFFWRIFRFSVGLTLCLLFYVIVTLTITYLIAGGKLSYWKLPLWGRQLYVSSGCAILIKPLLLIPAIIIVHDCNIRKAMGVLSEYKLSKAKEMLCIFVILHVCTFSYMLIWPYIASNVVCVWASGIAHNILSHILSLAMELTAVRFVASVKPPFVMHDELKEADGKGYESNL
jgi:hypothetical protein